MTIKPSHENVIQVGLDHPRASDAEKYRLAQAQQLLDDYSATHGGQGADTIEELTAWVVAGMPKVA